MSAEDCVGCRHINNCLGDCLGYEEAKPQEQTNEEWLRQCSTEELAELLLRFYYQDYCMNTKRRVIEWLKQPHREE